MTAHGHATPGADAASHDHHYDGTPADRPGPGEPSTPLWLPLAGIGLVLVALLGYVVTRPAGKTGAELAQEASPEASAVPPAASAPPAGFRRVPGMASVFMPSGAGRNPPPPAAVPAAPPPAATKPTVTVVPKPFTKSAKPTPVAPPPAGAAPAPAPATK